VLKVKKYCITDDAIKRIWQLLLIEALTRLNDHSGSVLLRADATIYDDLCIEIIQLPDSAL